MNQENLIFTGQHRTTDGQERGLLFPVSSGSSKAKIYDYVVQYRIYVVPHNLWHP